MASDQMDTVDLLIRCALQSFEDTRVTCPVDWTVRQLKQQLSSVCSSKPEAGRQRLIYAGHCLQDERTLRSVFEGRIVDGDVRVIHLVCPPKDVPRFDRATKSNSSSNNNSGANGQDFTLNGQATTPSQSMGAPWGSFSAYPGAGFGVQQQQQLDSNPQFQNVYQAYMASYANYVQQMLVSSGQGVAPYASAAAVNNHYFVVPQFAVPQIQHFNHPVQVAAAARNAEARGAANVVQDALPGEGDVPQRDFLDVLYKAIRMCFLVMLVYVYSSAERFLGVLIFILAVWFVQARRDRNNRVRADQQLANAVNNVRQPQANGAEAGANPADSDRSSESDLLEHREQTAWNIFWSTCYTFITSFFTSLFPDNPVPVNVN